MRININNLSFTYYGNNGKSLDDINYEIEDKDSNIKAIGLLGPNGAGKSTLMYILSAMYKPTSGKVIEKDLNIELSNNKSLTDIAYLHKSLIYIPAVMEYQKGSTIGDFCDYSDFILNMNLNKEKFLSLLNEYEVDLKNISKNNDPFQIKLDKFSSGNFKKVILSIFYSYGINRFMLDEPTATLDPLLRRKFVDMITKSIEQNDTRYIISTHIVEDLDYIDYIICIRNGKIMTYGNKHKLMKEYSADNLNDLYYKIFTK